MHRLNPWWTGGALAVTAAVPYGVCTLAVAICPAGTLALFSVLTHGLDLKPLLPAAGALFVWSYNRLGGTRSTADRVPPARSQGT